MTIGSRTCHDPVNARMADSARSGQPQPGEEVGVGLPEAHPLQRRQRRCQILRDLSQIPNSAFVDSSSFGCFHQMAEYIHQIVPLCAKRYAIFRIDRCPTRLDGG